MEGEEWGEFLHMEGKKFFDFHEIREEITRRTDEIAGDDKNVTNDVIALTISSPYVLDLTMVDLPGITKVPVRG